MLLYGTIQNLITTSHCEVYNFSSLNESYEKLFIMPPFNFGGDYNYNFDIMYANYILSNDEIFFNFMKIIFNLYLGKDVFILIDDDERIQALNESLFKLIQQRYGYEAYPIQSMEDFLQAEDSSFSDFGLLNLDQDKERLSYYVERMRLQNGGIIGGEY